MNLLIKNARLSAARLFLAGALVFGVASGSVFAQSSGSTLSPEAQQAMDRGKAAAEQKEWDLAIKYFSEARKAAPTSPYSLFNLAWAYDNAGERELIAIAWYRAYLAGVPNAANAEQVRERIVQLEVKAEANIGKLVRRAKEASLSIEDYLQGTKYNEGFADLAYERLVKAQLEFGDIVGAKATAPRIRRDASEWSWAYRYIAKAQLGLGDIAGARATASQITDDANKSYVYVEIAEAQVKAGDFAGAKSTATGFVDEYSRSKVYYLIAERQAEAGDITGSRESVAQAKAGAARAKEDLKTSLYEGIARAQAKAGDFAGAREMAARTSNKWNSKARAYSDIAKAQAKAGDIAGAKETVARIKDEGWKSSAYQDIASAQAKSGDIAGAKETAALITKHERFKVNAHLTIAEGQIKVGDVVGARESIAKALHWAVAIEDANQKVNAHLTIAEGQIKVGDVVGARESIAKTLQWAVALELRHNKLTVFRKIAKLQLKVGDITGAKRTAAARVQALATWGMQEWTEYNQANYSYLSEPAVADFKQFLKSLEDKNPIQVTNALAQAVEDMAKALKKLREEEANWQVWVKRLGSPAERHSRPSL